MKQTIRIGTRGSKLALYQAYRVKDELEAQFDDINFEIIIIKTKGDKILDVPLSKIGDKGLFTKELEVAMFNKEIDMAVHSLKDLPTTFPEGAKLGAVLERGDVRDAIISLDKKKLSDLTPDDIIATSSLRRKAQLLRINKDYKIVEIRGNVNTRLRKMEEGYCTVMVMAAAGLQRLEMGEFISHLLDVDMMIPACSQGAIAIEIRDDGDSFIENILSRINHEETMITTTAERAFLKTLEGGCQIPVGSFSYVKDGHFHITGFISDIDGKRFLKDSATANVEDAVKVSVALANKLYCKGGKEILETIRQQILPVEHGSLPLRDKIIISTRAIEAGDNFLELLHSKGAKILSLPMIEILPVDPDKEDAELLKNVSSFDWIFFTSKNGVSNFFKLLSDNKGNTDLGENIKKAVIGSATAAELDYYGYAPDFISQGNTSEEMLEQFIAEKNPVNQKILLALGKLADDTLKQKMENNNEVTRINVYDTVKPSTADASIMDIIMKDEYDMIVFTSPSTFHNFCSFYNMDKMKDLKIASIGNTTTAAIRQSGIEPLITARISNAEGLCEAITEYYKN